MPIDSQAMLYDHRDFGRFPKHRLRTILPAIPRSKVKMLDVGCGEGQFYDAIREYRPQLDYYGIDLSEGQVNKAKNKGLKVVSHDVTKHWPFPDSSFDVVVAFEIVEHVFDTDFFVQECRRVLKDDGIFVLTTPNVAALGERLRLLRGIKPSMVECRVSENSSGHIRAFDYSNLYSLVRDNGFRGIRITGRDFHLPLVRHNQKYLGRINMLFCKAFPKLSAGFILFAKK